jgi:hypothetical protein
MEVYQYEKLLWHTELRVQWIVLNVILNISILREYSRFYLFKKFITLKK